MTWDDLKRLFLSPTLFRLDAMLAPRLVPVVYFLGLIAILLWAVSHLFWTFGSNFGNGLWGLLEIVVFGLLWLVLLRIACEAVLVFFRAHDTEIRAMERTRLPSSLVDDLRDAIHDLAEEDEFPPPAEPPPGSGPLDPPVRGPVVKRTAKRTPPTLE